jgi:hypothetical protein
MKLLDSRTRMHREAVYFASFLDSRVEMSLSLSVYLSLYLSVSLSLFLSVCPFLSVSLSLCLFISLSLCLSVSLSPCLSVSLRNESTKQIFWNQYGFANPKPRICMDSGLFKVCLCTKDSSGFVRICWICENRSNLLKISLWNESTKQIFWKH